MKSYHSVLANSEFYKQTKDGTPVTMAQARQTASNILIDRLGYNLYNVANNKLVNPATGKLNSSAKLLIDESWRCSF